VCRHQKHTPKRRIGWPRKDWEGLSEGKVFQERNNRCKGPEVRAIWFLGMERVTGRWSRTRLERKAESPCRLASITVAKASGSYGPRPCMSLGSDKAGWVLTAGIMLAHRATGARLGTHGGQQFQGVMVA
jgi:hypothetical protein